MATASITLSQFSSNVKAVHTGVIFAGGHASSTQTWSGSGVLLLTRVPNGATLLDWWVKIGGTQAATAQTMKLGTRAAPSAIMAVTSLSTTYSISAQNTAPVAFGIYNQGWLRAPGGTDLMPVRISLSDDLQPARVWIAAKLAISLSGHMTFGLFYTMDGTAGRTTTR